MRDFQIWFYVLLGVIYLLSRFLKKPVQQKPKDLTDFKPEKPATRFEPPPVKPGTAPGKMLTFEELLDICQAKFDNVFTFGQIDQVITTFYKENQYHFVFICTGKK